jgi:hypothetical protein
MDPPGNKSTVLQISGFSRGRSLSERCRLFSGPDIQISFQNDPAYHDSISFSFEYCTVFFDGTAERNLANSNYRATYNDSDGY